MTQLIEGRSYYEASANPRRDFPALSGDVTTDVCVIGGGYTGLSAALHLAERGYRVVLLEAERIGFGASGRNGGQITTGYAPGMARTIAIAGREAASAMFAIAEEAKSMIAERVSRHRIDCELTYGYLHAAAKPGHMSELAEEARLLSEDFGYPGLELIGSAEAAERVGTDRFAGALFDPGSGHLHPLNYALGLGAAAGAAGVRIHEKTRAEAIAEGQKAIVRTAQGRVQAEFVVLAGNAYLGDLEPRIKRRIMPVGTYILATEPLGEARAGRLIPGNEAVCDTNFVLDYFRLSGDRRMLFGGRVSYLGRESPRNLLSVMRRRMLRTYPDLADARVAYIWGGHVAITRNRLPHLGRVGRSIYFAQGFSGQGVALTGVAGKLIAEAIAGTAERFDVFQRIRHREFPGGRRLRTPILLLATTWYRLRDML